MTLLLALSYDSKFMTPKGEKRKKSAVLNLKHFVTKYLSMYFHLDTLSFFPVRPYSIGIFLPYTPCFSVGTGRILLLRVIGRRLIHLNKFSRTLFRSCRFFRLLKVLLRFYFSV